MRLLKKSSLKERFYVNGDTQMTSTLRGVHLNIWNWTSKVNGWKNFEHRWTRVWGSWKLDSFHGRHMCIIPNKLGFDDIYIERVLHVFHKECFNNSDHRSGKPRFLQSSWTIKEKKKSWEKVEQHWVFYKGRLFKGNNSDQFKIMGRKNWGRCVNTPSWNMVKYFQHNFVRNNKIH